MEGLSEEIFVGLEIHRKSAYATALDATGGKWEGLVGDSYPCAI